MALENLSFGFLKPNFLETMLYSGTASSDKVTRMEKAARDTTSFEMGVQLAGLPGIAFILFLSGARRELIPFIPMTSRSTITSPPFPSMSPSEWTGASPNSCPSHSTHFTNNVDLFIPSSLLAFRKIACPRPPCGEILLDVYATLELRMVRGSLLIIYEVEYACVEEGVYLEPVRVWGRRRFGTRSKMRRMVMNPTTKLAPDPIYILGHGSSVELVGR